MSLEAKTSSLLFPLYLSIVCVNREKGRPPAFAKSTQGSQKDFHGQFKFSNGLSRTQVGLPFIRSEGHNYGIVVVGFMVHNYMLSL